MNRTEHVFEGLAKLGELVGTSGQPIGFDTANELQGAPRMHETLALLMELLDIALHGLRRHGGLELRVHPLGKHEMLGLGEGR